MGQKVSPLLMRIGYIENWRSIWFADKKEFSKNVVEDFKIRKFIRKKFEQAAVSRVDIERADKTKVIIHSARPGVIIGRRGADIDKLREELGKIVTKGEVEIATREVKNASADAQLIAQNVCFQLEKRIAFRRALKRAVEQAVQMGVKGIKISVSGRLNGAEMARREKISFGKLPLHTLRANIEYGFYEALTTYGIIGAKVWVYKGDIILEKNKKIVGLGSVPGAVAPEIKA